MNAKTGGAEITSIILLAPLFTLPPSLLTHVCLCCSIPPPPSSTLHPLLIPPPVTLHTTPRHRLQTLTQFSAPLLTLYHTTSPTSLPPLVTTLTTQTTHSLALVTLLTHKTTTLETLHYTTQLAQCYDRQDLHVQAEKHAMDALNYTTLPTITAPPPPTRQSGAARVAATSLLAYFGALHAAADSNGLVTLSKIRKGCPREIYMDSLLGATTAAFQGVETQTLTALVVKVRRDSAFVQSVEAVVGEVEGEVLAALKEVVARADEHTHEADSSSSSRDSLPSITHLVSSLRSDYVTHARTEGVGLVAALSTRMTSVKATVCAFEELVAIYYLCPGRQNESEYRKLQVSLYQEKLLTILGKSLVGMGKIKKGLETLADAKRLSDEGGREDCLSTCETLSAYGNALVAEWRAKQGGAGNTGAKGGKKGGARLSKALEFEQQEEEKGTVTVEKQRRQARQTDFGETQWTLQMKETKFKNPLKPETDLPLADELLTHCHDIMESSFGRNHALVAKASCAVAFLAVLQDHFEDGKAFLEKAFEVYKIVGEGEEGDGVGKASVR